MALRRRRPRQQESIGPDFPQACVRDSSLTHKLANFRQRKRSGDRLRAIGEHDMITGHKSKYDLRGGVAPAAANQIIDEDETSGRPRHDLQQRNRAIFIQMVKKQRTHHDIESLAGKVFEDIADAKVDLEIGAIRIVGRSASAGIVDRRLTHVATGELQHRSRSCGSPTQVEQHVSAAAGQIQHLQRSRVGGSRERSERLPGDRSGTANRVDSFEIAESAVVDFFGNTGLIEQFRAKVSSRKSEQQFILSAIESPRAAEKCSARRSAIFRSILSDRSLRQQSDEATPILQFAGSEK